MTPFPGDLTRLSKTMSHALRHAPEEYGIRLDPEGWVPAEELFRAIGERVPALAGATVADVERILASSEKARFEVDGGRVRARYGHSTGERIEHPRAEEVPAVLYHGTAERSVAAILREGLRPGRRQYVHLSGTPELARSVGARHGSPVVLRVDTGVARADGVEFSVVDADVYLADRIPPTAIRRADVP